MLTFKVKPNSTDYGPTDLAGNSVLRHYYLWADVGSGLPNKKRSVILYAPDRLKIGNAPVTSPWVEVVNNGTDWVTTGPGENGQPAWSETTSTLNWTIGCGSGANLPTFNQTWEGGPNTGSTHGYNWSLSVAFCREQFLNIDFGGMGGNIFYAGQGRSLAEAAARSPAPVGAIPEKLFPEVPANSVTPGIASKVKFRPRNIQGVENNFSNAAPWLLASHSLEGTGGSEYKTCNAYSSRAACTPSTIIRNDGTQVLNQPADVQNVWTSQFSAVSTNYLYITASDSYIRRVEVDSTTAGLNFFLLRQTRFLFADGSTAVFIWDPSLYEKLYRGP